MFKCLCGKMKGLLKGKVLEHEMSSRSEESGGGVRRWSRKVRGGTLDPRLA